MLKYYFKISELEIFNVLFRKFYNKKLFKNVS